MPNITICKNHREPLDISLGKLDQIGLVHASTKDREACSCPVWCCRCPRRKTTCCCQEKRHPPHTGHCQQSHRLCCRFWHSRSRPEPKHTQAFLPQRSGSPQRSWLLWPNHRQSNRKSLVVLLRRSTLVSWQRSWRFQTLAGSLGCSSLSQCVCVFDCVCARIEFSKKNLMHSWNLRPTDQRKHRKTRKT